MRDLTKEDMLEVIQRVSQLYVEKRIEEEKPLDDQYGEVVEGAVVDIQNAIDKVI